MKNTAALFALIALTATRGGAQTNTGSTNTALDGIAPSITLANGAPAPAADKTKYDLTLGAAGDVVPKTGENESGFSLSLSADPFKQWRQLWLGGSQSLSWKPFAGSTDLDAEWQIAVYKDTVYVLPAWSVGCAYGNESGPAWRTGPELLAQYYTTDHSFIYSQVNYDLLVTRGDHGLRWSIGIGLEF
jgi:hypothetical protein